MAEHKILLIGATETFTGVEFIREALPIKANLTVYTQSLNQLPDGLHNWVKVIEGRLDDRSKLEQALEGIDAVVSMYEGPFYISTFLTRPKTTPVADAFPVLVSAMRSMNVRRLLVMSTALYREAGETLNWSYWAWCHISRFLMPQGSADLVAISRYVVQQHDLDWTVYRVPHLTDFSELLPVRAGKLDAYYKGSLNVSRSSMARWLLREIEDPQFIRKTIMLANE